MFVGAGVGGESEHDEEAHEGEEEAESSRAETIGEAVNEEFMILKLSSLHVGVTTHITFTWAVSEGKLSVRPSRSDCQCDRWFRDARVVLSHWWQR